MIIQIYEIQTPREAEEVIALGVDRVGSVIVDETRWREPLVRETIAAVRVLGGVSSLIPLFNREEAVLRTLDYYRPDMVHFCDALPVGKAAAPARAAPARLQARVRERFPGIAVMRSIPIPRPGAAPESGASAVDLAREFAPSSDYFLTDTLLTKGPSAAAGDQPVAGFIGITGLTCDWAAARRLVDESRVPVILAGGLTPDNVYAGILSVRPAGVDSCTGTNAVDARGAPIRFRKDPERVRRFVAETRRAQGEIRG